MKILSLMAIAMTVSSCASFYDNFNHHRDLNGLAAIGLIPEKQANGLRSYDVCVACGEKWEFVPHPDPIGLETLSPHTTTPPLRREQ